MEIQTIHLYRDMDTDIQLKGNERMFRATDYFDCLIAKERTLDDTFCSIMNLEQDDIVEDDTSMQSYTLYFDEGMQTTYANEMRLSPFMQNNGEVCDRPFLSIIQVHITTESLRRIKIDDSEKIIEQYQCDIVDVVKKFKNEESEDDFIFRVYKLFSAGDFAVVVRSSLPETSFKISTLLRCRMAGTASEPGENTASNWALYKTYTLLAFDEALINKKLNNYNNEDDQTTGKLNDHNNEDNQTIGKFVIRGCYSCQYWADEDIKNTYQEYKFGNLNGRYDFSVEISEIEFYQIYKYIKNYKSNNKIEDDVLKDKTKAQLVLLKLSQKQFLSYVNIRYLIPQINKKYREKTGSAKIIIDNDRNEKNKLPELKEENREQILELQKKYIELEKKYREILKSQQNAEQYFKMLGKSIRSCYSLNNQPDTRIYVVGISQQLDIVLNGMRVYFELYQSADQASKRYIAYVTVDYIRIALHTIDNYLEYVRNNNLQSLQTPNYNLESNMGMEKILIAYSEYLMNITEIMSWCLSDGETKKEFYPIVVPDLNSSDICVEALFIEGYGVDNAREQELRMKFDGNRYMVVIGSPTLSELGDIPVFTAMLFHELAHQYRYESRIKRNQVVRDLVLREYANLITDNIINLAEHQTGVQDEEQRLFSILNKAVYEGLDQYVYTELEIEDKEIKTPLVYFREQLKCYIEEFNFYIGERLDFENRTVKFVKDLSDVIDITEEGKKYIIYLYDKLDGKAAVQGVISYLEQLEMASFKVAAFCVVKECKMDISDKRIQKIMNLDDGSVPEDENCFGFLWEILRTHATENEEIIEQIKEKWESYVYFIEEWCSDVNDFLPQLRYEKIQDFENCVYKTATEAWKEENKKFNESKMDGYRDWTLLGRWLQIDNNQRKEVFWDNIRYSFKNIELKSIDEEISKYREVTSDIAMYVMMNLEPFEYIKLMATILPEDDWLTLFSTDRIITVITVMQDRNLDVKQMYKTFLQEEIIIVEKLQKFCENLQKKEEKDKVIELLKGIIDQLKNKQIDDTCINILPIIADLEVQKGNIVLENEEIFSYVIKILKVLDNMLHRDRYYITLLFENTVLLKDYRDGVEEMQNIMKKMNDDNTFPIKQIRKMCNSSKKYISEKHYKTGIVRDKQFNKESIDFLLSLYYERKIRNARESRGLKE